MAAPRRVLLGGSGGGVPDTASGAVRLWKRDAMRAFFGEHRRVLDAGCGSGFGSSLWLDVVAGDRDSEWIGADISEAIDVARDRLAHIPGTHFVQAGILQLPFRALRSGCDKANRDVIHFLRTSFSRVFLGEAEKPS